MKNKQITKGYAEWYESIHQDNMSIIILNVDVLHTLHFLKAKKRTKL